MQDTPRNIYTKFGSNLSYSFRGEEFCIIVNDDNNNERQVMAKNGKRYILLKINVMILFFTMQKFKIVKINALQKLVHLQYFIC